MHVPVSGSRTPEDQIIHHMTNNVGVSDDCQEKAHGKYICGGVVDIYGHFVLISISASYQYCSRCSRRPAAGLSADRVFIR